MRYFLLLAALLAAIPAAAQSDPAGEVSEARLRADVEALVGFGTRHTMSSQDDPARGIGAALRWGEAQFRAASESCGGCLEIVRPERMVTADRVPVPTRLVNVVAIQRGTERPNEVVIVQGHIDSRVSDVMNAAADAPGANDNASGSALTIEAARVLSQQRYPVTIAYALLSGEEQGLLGGELLADYARLHGWTVKAVLNNDIVGGSCGSDKHCDDRHVRVFSEGPRADGSEALRANVRRNGGENDSPSRNLSRFVARLAESDPGGLEVRQIWRTDRMGRGGDHIPFLDAGYPAIRFSVAVEDYEHQHQDLRVEDGVTYGDTVDEMDFPYLARVTRLNVRAAEALARAPTPPEVAIEAAVRTDTLLRWSPVPGAVRYEIYRRRTDQAEWEWRLTVGGGETSAGRAALPADGPIVVVLTPDRGDDWLFGVSAIAANGAESPVASAVPGGAFGPLD
ncbi:MAG: peptidase M28 [Sphingomonadales bacterium 32-68-7]|nr:MAG: peptidase M28 [Sphingomonadales bacterium 32-68-7]